MKRVELQSLRIENFKSRELFELDFGRSPSFVLITGPNGAGKTTVLDAVCFAFLGRGVSDRKVKKSDLQRKGSTRPLRVSLSLLSGGTPFEISRGLSDVKILENGQVRANSLQEAERFIVSEFADYSRLVNQVLICPFSARSKLFAYLSDPEKLNFLKKLFEIEKYERAAERAKERLRKTEEEIRLKKAEKDQFLEKLYRSRLAQIEEKKENLRRLREEELRLKSEIQRLKRSLVGLVKSRRREKEELFKIEKELSSVLERVSKSRKEFEELSGSERRLREKKLKEVSRKIEEFSLERERLAKEIEEKKTQLSEKKLSLRKEAEFEKEKVRSQAEKIFSDIREAESELLGRLSEKKAELKKVSSQIRDLEKRLHRVREGLRDEKCPLCGQPLKEHKEKIEREVRETEEQLQNFEKKKFQIERDLKVSEENLKQLRLLAEKEKEEFKKKISLIDQRLLSREREAESETESEIRKREKEMEEISRTLEVFKKSASAICENDPDLLNLKRELNRVSEEIEELLRQSEELQKKRDRILKSQTGPALAKTREALRQKWQNFQSVRKAYLDLSSEIERSRREVELEKERETKRIEEELSRLEREREAYGFWKWAFSKPLISLMVYERVKEIEKRANELADSMGIQIEFKFDFDQKRQILTLDAKMLESQSTRSQFSRGEESLFSFILTLALIEALENYSSVEFDTIFFDETLDSLDEENSYSVLKELYRFSRSRNKKVFLISHSEAVKSFEYVDRVIDLSRDPVSS